MRTITEKSINAFINATNFNSSNTIVNLVGDFTFLSLFGNLIAKRNKKTGVISITNCGWFTNTTKERLNAIPGVSIVQKAGKWYLNGNEWDGNWIEIKG